MSILIIIILISALFINNRRCEFCGKIKLRLHKIKIREDEDDFGHWEIWCEECLSHLPDEYD